MIIKNLMNEPFNQNNTFVEKMLNYVTGDQKVEIADKFLTKEIISVFKDSELKNSIDAFFKNNLNVSETSRNAFMHRNTLIYRIDKIQKLTGMNIRDLDDAVKMMFLMSIYERTKNIR